MLHFGALSIISDFFALLALAAAGVEAWAFIDAITRPSRAFPIAGKKTKELWLVITGVAAVVGLGYAVFVGAASAVSLLPVAAFVAAAVYLTDVRPKVKEFSDKNGGGGPSGPYGPW